MTAPLGLIFKSPAVPLHVAPPGRLAARLAQVVVSNTLTSAVPGVIATMVGGGGSQVCGSWITPPVTVAPPLEDRALTFPLLQLPTPVRGVYSEPLTTVVVPVSVMFPF